MKPTGQKSNKVKRATNVRQPSQQRSQERVEKILRASEKLIAENGSAQLRIQDIAKQANVTPGSIYQYFPNVSKIIQTLGNEYLLQIGDTVTEKLENKPTSIEEFFDQLSELFDYYYDLYNGDPVIQDVWDGITTNKSMRNLDDADTKRNVERIFNQSRHLFKKSSHQDLKRTIELILVFANTAVKISAGKSRPDAEAYSAISKKMLKSALKEVCIGLVAQSKG